MKSLSRPVKRGQEFVHKYYESIKLFLLVLIIVMAGIIIYSMLNQAAADRARRAEEQTQRVKAVEDVSQRIDDKTDEVLARVERSESLLCALFLQHDIDIELPPELEKRCQKELKERSQASAEPSATSSPQPTPQTSPSNTQPNNPPSEPPRKTGLQRAVDRVRGAAKGLLNIVQSVL